MTALIVDTSAILAIFDEAYDEHQARNRLLLATLAIAASALRADGSHRTFCASRIGCPAPSSASSSWC